MASLIGLIKRNYATFYPTPVPKNQGALRFGILGAANIAPIVLILPAKTHADVEIYAVAARDLTRAQAFAKKHSITKAYGSYQKCVALLDDPDVDVVYNPLPNGLHFEWTLKALAAGKHVLLEKPSSNTAEETRQMFALAEEKRLVLLEAFHYRFHPSIQRTKAILDDGSLGAIKSVESTMTVFAGFIPLDDIRLNLQLGGGALMDMGCYTVQSIRFLTSSEPTEVIEASHIIQDGNPNVDRRSTATLALPNDVVASLEADLREPLKWGFLPRIPRLNVKIQCEGGSVEQTNFVGPSLFHRITVERKDGKGNIKTTTETAYTGSRGDASWTTYRHQLEAFVDKVRGREPQHWVSGEDSVANLHWIEQIYHKGGLSSRPASIFKLVQ